MSYLLEALKKSERQRLATTPTLNSTVMVPVRRRSAPPTALISAGIGFAVLAIALGWWLGTRKTQAEPAAATTPATIVQAHSPTIVPTPAPVVEAPAPAAAATAQATLPVAVPAAPVVTASPRPEPAPPAKPTSVREIRRQEPPARPPAPAPAKTPEPRLIAAPQLSAVPQPSKPVAAPATPVAAPAAPAASAPAVHAPEPRETVPARVMTYNELPASVRQALPALTLSGYVQGGDGNMMAAVNDHLLREGEEAGPGLVVDKILSDGVIFRFRGYRFRR